MTRSTNGPWLADAIRGGIAGLVGTWVMDLVTTGLLESQTEESKRQEEAARPNGKSSVANLVDRMEAVTGITLDDGQRSVATQVIHYGLGVVPGVMYVVASRRAPRLAAGRGLAYGLALWVVNDEYLNTRLGLAGPYAAYPIETHWRGFVGHVVLGMATEGWSAVLGA